MITTLSASRLPLAAMRFPLTASRSALAALLLALCSLPFAPCASASLAISAGPASNITTTAAQFHGTLTATNGSGSNVVITAFYGTSDQTTNAALWASTNLISTNAALGFFSNLVSSLTPAQLYYYRFRAIETTNTAWSGTTNFWTLAGAPTSSVPVATNMPLIVTTNGTIKAPTAFFTANSNAIKLAIGYAGAGAGSGDMNSLVYDPAAGGRQVAFSNDLTVVSNLAAAASGISAATATNIAETVVGTILIPVSNLAAAASAASGSNTAWLATLAPSQAVDRAIIGTVSNTVAGVVNGTNDYLRIEGATGNSMMTGPLGMGQNPITNVSHLSVSSVEGEVGTGGRIIVGKRQYTDGGFPYNIDAYSFGSAIFGYIGGVDTPQIVASEGCMMLGRWQSENSVISNSYGSLMMGQCYFGGVWSGGDQGPEIVDSRGALLMGEWGGGRVQLGPLAHGSVIMGVNISRGLPGDDVMNGGATNAAMGSLLMFAWDGPNSNHTAWIKENADMSIGQGDVVVSNPMCIVSGQGQVSHGSGTHTAENGFWHGTTNIDNKYLALTATNQWAIDLTNRTIQAIGSTSTGGLASIVYVDIATNALRIDATNAAIQGARVWTNNLIGASVIGANGRMACGVGVSVTNIVVSAYGAQQIGYNSSTQTIGVSAHGAQQMGYNSSTQTIAANAYGSCQIGFNHVGMQIIGSDAHGAQQLGDNAGIQIITNNSHGAQQLGYNEGTQIISNYTYGAQQIGFNQGTQIIGTNAHGAVQRGKVAASASAINIGVGAVQLLDLTAGQNALTTINGNGSILLGAGTSSNRYAIVAGDGQSAHGDGSVTAGGGFWHGTTNILTQMTNEVSQKLFGGTNIIAQLTIISNAIVAGGSTTDTVARAWLDTLTASQQVDRAWLGLLDGSNQVTRTMAAGATSTGQTAAVMATGLTSTQAVHATWLGLLADSGTVTRALATRAVTNIVPVSFQTATQEIWWIAKASQDYTLKTITGSCSNGPVTGDVVLRQSGTAWMSQILVANPSISISTGGVTDTTWDIGVWSNGWIIGWWCTNTANATPYDFQIEATGNQ